MLFSGIQPKTGIILGQTPHGLWNRFTCNKLGITDVKSIVVYIALLPMTTEDCVAHLINKYQYLFFDFQALQPVE